MIVRGTLVGTCVVNDLDIKVAGGQICELSNEFSKEEIKRSMTPPKGGLHTAIAHGLIEVITPDNLDYRRWRERQDRDKREILRKRKRKELSREMTNYWQMGRGQRLNYIRTLTDIDLALLERARDRENDRGVLDLINEKLSLYVDVKVPDEFVLL